MLRKLVLAVIPCALFLTSGMATAETPHSLTKEQRAIQRWKQGVPMSIAFGPPGTYCAPGMEWSLRGRGNAELRVMRQRMKRQNSYPARLWKHRR